MEFFSFLFLIFFSYFSFFHTLYFFSNFHASLSFQTELNGIIDILLHTFLRDFISWNVRVKAKKFSIDSNSYNGTKFDKTQNNQGSKNIQVFFSYVALVGQELEIIKDEALILFCKIKLFLIWEVPLVSSN